MTGTSSKFVDARRRNVAGPALTEQQRANLIEVLGGVPITRKRPPVAANVSPLLVPGTYVRSGDGTVFYVEKVGPGSAEVRGVLGRQSGETLTVSRSAAGFRVVPPEELESQRQAALAAKALERDESSCPNCWDGDRAVDGVDRGRDPNCADHRPSKEAVARAERGSSRRRVESPADVARVLELRGQGLSYQKIEAEMGWATHGSRAYKIVKTAEAESAKEAA